MEPLIGSPRQVLDDVNSLPVLRRSTPLSDIAVPKEAMPQVAVAPGPVTQAEPTGLSLPEAIQSFPAAQLAPAPQSSPAPAAQPSRLLDRVNSLYGEKLTAEQRAEAAEQRLQNLLQTLNQAPPSYAPPAPQQPVYQPQQNSFEAPAPTSPPADYISRAELARILQERDSHIAAETQLRQAHTFSRLEAERQYPDVFENPEARAALDRVWSNDRFLQADPRGPEKAAAFVRGMLYDPRHPVATAPAAAVQKQALVGLGTGAPVGSGAPAADQAQVNAAVARARQSGRREDWLAVYNLQGFGNQPL